MAWLTQEDYQSYSQQPQEPDTNTLMYWVSRLEPVIRAESSDEVIVVFANRTGTEGEAIYAGTSAVVGIKNGEVLVYGILGRGEKDLLVVDTEEAPFAKMVYRPEGETTKTDRSPIGAGESEQPEAQRDTVNEAQQPSQKSPTEVYSDRDKPKDSDPEPEDRVSSYRRDDLSIKVVHDRRYEKLITSPFVHTPSAPSPTPQHIRPYVERKSESTVGQIHREAYASSQRPTDTLLDDEREHGDEIRFEQLSRARGTSPSNSSESHFSDFSGISSRRDRRTPGKSALKTQENSWTKNHNREEEGDDVEIISDFGSALEHNNHNNRHSLRSDVSVWNNYTGRPRQMAAPLPDRSTQQVDRHEENRAKGGEATRATRPSSSKLPQSAKPRSNSRAHDHQRSTSAMQPSDLGDIRKRLQGIALRAESANALVPDSHEQTDLMVSKLPDWETQELKSHLDRLKAQQESKSSHNRAFSNESIPIALDVDTWARTVESVTGQGSSKRHHDPSGSILRPASHSRVAAGTSTPDRKPENDRASRFQDHTPDSRGRQDRKAREISRGRRRGTDASLNQQNHSPLKEHRRGSSRREQTTSVDPIDLSQFRLIEDYPSPNCPLHGSRSRSRAGHRNRSSRRTPASGRNHRPSRQGRESRPPSQDAGPDLSNARNRPRTSSRAATQSAQPNLASYVTSTAAVATQPAAATNPQELSDSTGTMTSSVSTLSPKPEPKTPVAMVLVAEDEDEKYKPPEPLRPLKCIERSSEMEIGRPRSAVW